ncbi:hydrogenase accessory protein HypB, partial [Alkaliphilus transvaalensis]|nr:hydrogenase accessory protein HypB [Alkaliphilus transvaalensis]
MDSFKVLEIKESVFEDNDRQADLLREELKKEKTFLLNLMSSPGSGKTTTVVKTIEALKDEMQIGVLEADIDSDIDATTVAQT